MTGRVAAADQRCILGFQYLSFVNIPTSAAAATAVAAAAVAAAAVAEATEATAAAVASVAAAAAVAAAASTDNPAVRITDEVFLRVDGRAGERARETIGSTIQTIKLPYPFIFQLSHTFCIDRSGRELRIATAGQ